MNSFITVTKYDMSSSKPNNNASAQMIVQNGTPNFTPLSPFKYKEYSNTDSKDKQCTISFKTLSKLKSKEKSQNDELNSIPNNSKNNDFVSKANKNLQNVQHSEDQLSNSNDANSILAPNSIYQNNENEQDQSTKKKKKKNHYKKEFKIKLSRAITPTRRSRTVQTSIPKQRTHTPSENGQFREHHVINTFKNISKSKEKVFDNAQKIRYKKAIQNFDKIENYKDRMIDFEVEKITARFSPTKNTEFGSTQMANPIMTSTQRSQKRIKYYFPPSHIGNTSKVKSYNGLVNYDRGITEAVAEIRRDRLKADYMFQY